MAIIAEPEFASVESFVEFLLDDERTSFSPGEAQKVATRTHCSLSQIIEELKGFGLGISLNHSANQGKNVRGINSHSHGTHPFGGNNSTFTTPGGSNIMGFAGRSGS